MPEEQGPPSMSVDKYHNQQTQIIRESSLGSGPIGRLERIMGELDKGMLAEIDAPPIALYSRALKKVRSQSSKARTARDQMTTARSLQEQLGHVGEVLGLPKDHFSINTSGDPLVIEEGRGEHTILPTHLEGGAYFNHPHADHQLKYTPDEVPKIKIGQYVRIGGKVGINAGNDVTLGDGVWLAPDSYVLLQDHSGYERPSVGSRTVAATRLPGIEFADYAMVGRKSVIKWDVGYVGKGSVVALLSAIGKNVGDYSITGDKDKILGYLPFRAALMEYGNPSFEDLLRISDWNQVKSDWIKQYERFMAQTDCTSVIPALLDVLTTTAERKKPSMLDMNPGIGNATIEASRLGITVDAVSTSRDMFPVILQRAENAGTRNIRLRGGVNTEKLPYPTGEKDPIRNRVVGYNLVLNTGNTPKMSIESIEKQLSEATRVARPDGTIVFGFNGEADAGRTVATAHNWGLQLTSETIKPDENGARQHLLTFRK